jgi:uncharacterized protein YcfL
MSQLISRRALLLGLVITPLMLAPHFSLAAPLNSKVEALGVPDYLVVDEIRATKRNGLLALQATIYNTDTYDHAMRYRFRWIDVQGFDVGGEEAWKPLLVHGTQSQRIQTVAPTPQAVDFTLQIHADENTAN